MGLFCNWLVELGDLVSHIEGIFGARWFGCILEETYGVMGRYLILCIILYLSNK